MYYANSYSIINCMVDMYRGDFESVVLFERITAMHKGSGHEILILKK